MGQFDLSLIAWSDVEFDGVLTDILGLKIGATFQFDTSAEIGMLIMTTASADAEAYISMPAVCWSLPLQIDAFSESEGGSDNYPGFAWALTDYCDPISFEGVLVLNDYGSFIYELEGSTSTSTSTTTQVTARTVFTYSPPSASARWDIFHPFNYPPMVTVIDSTGEQVFALVTYPGTGEVLIEFTSATSGYAYLS